MSLRSVALICLLLLIFQQVWWVGGHLEWVLGHPREYLSTSLDRFVMMFFFLMLALNSRR